MSSITSTTSTSTSAPVHYGPYQRGAPLGQWGGGFFAARDEDEGKTVIVQVAFASESSALDDASPLAREAVWRSSKPHPNMPKLVEYDEESIGEPLTWVAYEPVVAIRMSDVVGVHPVPIVLTWAAELVAVMQHHRRYQTARAPGWPRSGDDDPLAVDAGVDGLRPRFADLLVTKAGRLLVLTTPAIGRTWRTSLLRESNHDAVLLPPRDAAVALAPSAPTSADVQLGNDIFAAGAFARFMLRETAAEPRRDIPARVHQLVERACATERHERHESLDELERELRACLDEFPPLDDAERAAAALAGSTWAAQSMKQAEKALAPT